MSDNLKPGDLCVIVKCKSSPEFVGMSVELIAQVLPGQCYYVPDTPYAFKNDGDYSGWVVEGEGFPMTFNNRVQEISPFACFADECLMKINGDPDEHKELKSKIPEKEHA
jgi:hypothetical protein